MVATLVTIACGAGGPSPAGTPLAVDELKFKVIDAVGTPVYCDPDFYPVAHEGGEQASALAQYPQIRARADTYAAILAHEHLPSGDLTDPQKLTVYRAYKLLTALTLAKSGDDYGFEVRVRDAGDGLQMVSGAVRVDGVVTVKSRVAAGPPNCPICLAAGTLIATPGGAVRVVDIRPGLVVWTTSLQGTRVAAPVLEVGNMQVPAGHQMVHLVLVDGRDLLASPGRPRRRRPRTSAR